jgi:hypothetical protein
MPHKCGRDSFICIIAKIFQNIALDSLPVPSDLQTACTFDLETNS